jgi:ABC-type dipeptide/oligopeptide/nickel transport system permease component
MDPLAELLAQSTDLLLVATILSLACAALCGFIAARRKARWVYWSAMGFLFGPFALPFVFAAKPKQPK